MNLTVAPEAYSFTSSERSTLMEMLAEVDRNTVLISLGSTTDIVLSENGLTREGYSLTDTAFVQLCTLSSPGLAQLVPDISGQYRRAGEDRNFYSPALAIDTFNKIISLRFNTRINGLQLVRNTKTKTIDGVVGARYRYLANSDFIYRLEQAIARTAYTFHSAFLCNRNITIRYCSKTKYNICGDTFFPGYYFGNCEIGGKSVRATCMLVHENSNCCAIGNFGHREGGRVVHSGRVFERRLHTLLENIANKSLSDFALREIGNQLNTAYILNPDSTKRRKHLAKKLVGKKLTLTFAERVIASAASKGRNNDANNLLPEEAKEVISSRTMYDLLISLIRESENLPIEQRETAEQLAYSLLIGRVTLT